MSSTEAAGAARTTDSGIEIKPVYHDDDVASLDLAASLGEPGEFPFVRGPYRTMYRERPWTMRQYAGFATAEETNERFRYLLANGAPGLSMAFDLPTQLGMDSDDPRALGEVGRVGVAIDSLDDMLRVFDGIPLDEVSTSMTINAPAAVLLLLYRQVGEAQGVTPDQLRGTIQNDILKEYIARGNYIFPPHASMRLTTDTFAYCAAEMPRFNTISISGYHIREAGSTAVQEVAFTLADGIAYVQAAVNAGLDVDRFAPRLSFFFNAHSNFLEEVAKFRAARGLWARIMRERFCAKDDKSMALRFHAQTGGSTLTAQQPDNNVVRVALQVLSAALGGAQSIHANGYDEALALPTEHSAKLALRTQQVIAEETGITDSADPLAGGWMVEALTTDIEKRASELIARIDERGGAVDSIEFMRDEIADAAFRWHKAMESGERTVVGINVQAEPDDSRIDILKIDPAIERAQVARLADLRAKRDEADVSAALDAVRSAARGTDNLLPPMHRALGARATIGEVCGVLREEFGEYDRVMAAAG
ncbi:MAG: methylmalonyl-CoA mutase [Actinobacteria bacterium]|nr:methylmalonyl-CoA mutase [Actinomycetota bacterium]